MVAKPGRRLGFLRNPLRHYLGKSAEVAMGVRLGAGSERYGMSGVGERFDAGEV